MNPILALAGLGAGLFILSKRNSGPVDDGIRKGIGTPTAVTGKSGTVWETQMTEAPTKPLSEGGAATIQVILNDPKIPARRHKVIEYTQRGTGSSQTRGLVGVGPSTPGLIQKAIADFGVTGPAAEAKLREIGAKS